MLFQEVHSKKTNSVRQGDRTQYEWAFKFEIVSKNVLEAFKQESVNVSYSSSTKGAPTL